MSLPASGQISFSDINNEFRLGFNRGSYRGALYFIDPGNKGAATSYGNIGQTNIGSGYFYGRRGPISQFLCGIRYSGVNQSTFSFTGVPLGPEHPSRVLFLITAVTGGGVASGATFNINGVNYGATLIRGATDGTLDLRMWRLSIATGTGGNITFNGSSSPMGAACTLYSLYGMNPVPVAFGAKGTGVNYPAVTLGPQDIAFYLHNNQPTFSGGAVFDVLNYGNGSPNNPWVTASLRQDALGGTTSYTVGTGTAGVASCQYCVFARA